MTSREAKEQLVLLSGYGTEFNEPDVDRLDCVDNRGLTDGRKAWPFLQQKFPRDETVTVVRVMRRLARVDLM